MNNDPDSTLPDLVDDVSDSDSENDSVRDGEMSEVVSNKYQWSLLKLVRLSFKRLQTDSSVDYLSGSDRSIIYLTSHVKDILMLSPNIERIRHDYKRLSISYTMTTDAETREYLGYSITRDRSNRILKLDHFGTES